MTPVQTSPRKVPLPLEGSLPLYISKGIGGPYVGRLLLVCIFAIIVRQTVLIRQRVTTVDFSAVDMYASVDIAIVCLAALVLIFSGSLGQTWSRLRRTPAAWLYGYYLVCAASFIWSSAPIYSLYRAMEYLILLSATFTAVAQYQDFAGAERAFLRVAAATLLLQMAATLHLIGFSLSLQAWHTNSYSASSAILFCYCLGEYLAMTKAERLEDKERSRRLWWFGIFALGTLALGTSAASNIAAASGCLLIFLALQRIGLALLGLWGLLLLFISGEGWQGLEGLFRVLFFPGKSEKAIETGTGRTLIWAHYWEVFIKSPVLGNGFGIINEAPNEASAALSHNSIFTILIGTGLVGLASFVAFAAKLWWSTVGQIGRRGPGTVGFAGALAAAFVNCLAMPLMADRWITTSVIFVWLLGLFFFQICGPRQAALPRGGLKRLAIVSGRVHNLAEVPPKVPVDCAKGQPFCINP